MTYDRDTTLLHLSLPRRALHPVFLHLPRVVRRPPVRAGASVSASPDGLPPSSSPLLCGLRLRGGAPGPVCGSCAGQRGSGGSPESSSVAPGAVSYWFFSWARRCTWHVCFRCCSVSSVGLSSLSDWSPSAPGFSTAGGDDAWRCAIWLGQRPIEPADSTASPFPFMFSLSSHCSSVRLSYHTHLQPSDELKLY